MTSYLGRGYDSVPGKPFQWAWYRERDEIRNHLIKRGRSFGNDMFAQFRMDQHISKIQRRIHKNKPTFAERSRAFAAHQVRSAPTPSFTDEELAHLIELFARANDPISAAIGLKAAEILQSR